MEGNNEKRNDRDIKTEEWLQAHGGALMVAVLGLCILVILVFAENDITKQRVECEEIREEQILSKAYFFNQ